MPKTHQEVILSAEMELLKALTNNDKELLSQVIHKDLVYTNENGQTFMGINNLQINDPNVLRICSLEIIEREINILVSIPTLH